MDVPRGLPGGGAPLGGTGVTAADEVVLTQVLLEDEAAAAAVDPLLAPDERARAGRFVFPVHARRFVVARGALRSILGALLDVPPATLRLDYGPQGKPYLPEAPEVSFNLTHSADRATVAVALGRRVGVDIEAPRGVRDPLRLARRFFAPGEIQELAQLDEGRRLAGFLHGWTRKEAFLKAVGSGLSGGLDSFDVSLTPGVPAVFRRLGPDAEGAEWQLHDLPPAAGWFGALVVEGGPVQVRQRSWEPGSP